jgi:hypothetical protein
MGTRSNICYTNADYSLKVAYCHFDGDVNHQGPILLKHYNSSELAEELVLNGYMSGLAPTIEEINERRVHKDKPERYESLGEYLTTLSSDIEYTYVWGHGVGFVNSPQWQVFIHGARVSAPLAQLLNNSTADGYTRRHKMLLTYQTLI